MSYKKNTFILEMYFYNSLEKLFAPMLLNLKRDPVLKQRHHIVGAHSGE